MISSSFIHTLLIWSVVVASGSACSPGEKTDDAQGRCCFFPFEYREKTYDSCTSLHNYGKPWCYLDAEENDWANCVDSCPPGKETDDDQGRCCFFPFEYKRKTYDNCTNVDRHRPWCYLDAEGKEWANCVQWKARGCYKDQNKVLDNKFATIKLSKKIWDSLGYPETIFNIAKELAEKEGFDVFGIRTMKRKKKFVILTTSDGKQLDSSAYGKDAGEKDCKFDGQVGVGVKRKVNFVYTKLKAN
ncbi:hypothetical protein ACROYT_G024997 [Oculina patagonica]